MLRDETFCADHELPLEIVISFSGADFERSTLYDAARSLLAGGGSVAVASKDGAAFLLETGQAAAASDEPSSFVLRCEDGQNFRLPDLGPLASDEDVRTAAVERYRRFAGLLGPDYQRWSQIVRTGPLSDEQFGELLADVALTPARSWRDIEDLFLRPGGVISPEDLVSSEPAAYAALIGEDVGAPEVATHVDARLRHRHADLIEWRPVDGALLALLTSCHEETVPDLSPLSERDVMAVGARLVADGDPLSRLGALQNLLSRIGGEEHARLEAAGDLARALFGDLDAFRADALLLCGLVVTASGVIARERLFAKSEPSYRRLAAWTWTSLAFRAVRGRVDADEVWRVAQEAYGFDALLRELADVDRDPAWRVEQFSPVLVEAELIGRFRLAGERFPEAFEAAGLGPVLGAALDSLEGRVSAIATHMPGPLDTQARSTSRRPMPEALVGPVLADLQPDLSVARFGGLLNSALLFDVPREITGRLEEVARAITLPSSPNSDAFDNLLRLAHAGAVLGLTALTEPAWDMARDAARRPQAAIELDDLLHIATFSAATATRMGFRDELARRLERLAFEILDKDLAAALLRVVDRLAFLLPEMRLPLARSIAALQSFVWSRA